LLLVSSSVSFKILVYNSRYAHSHSNFLGNIADVLVEAGHNVTSIIPIIDVDVLDAKDKSTKIYIEASEETREMRTLFAQQFASQCKAVLDQTVLLERLKNESYDVVIVEN
ncbi:hypothetical protein PENTCL1PPCAC_4911, partial [Pristionchus entomophagus]